MHRFQQAIPARFSAGVDRQRTRAAAYHVARTELPGYGLDWRITSPLARSVAFAPNEQSLERRQRSTVEHLRFRPMVNSGRHPAPGQLDSERVYGSWQISELALTPFRVIEILTTPSLVASHARCK